MKIQFALAALLSTTTIATAADVATRSPFLTQAPTPQSAPIFTSEAANWTGPYVGVAASSRSSGGTASLQSSNYTLPAFGNSNSVTLDPSNNPLASQSDTLSSLNAKDNASFFGGGLFAGYNVQSGNFVYGIEADGNYTLDRSKPRDTGNVDIHGDYTNNDSTNAGDTRTASGLIYSTAQSRMKWDGSLRLRAGVLASQNALLYATGGLAFGQIKRANTTTGSILFTADNGDSQADHAIIGASSMSQFRFGWTIGAGLDFRITDAWNLRGEYRYTDFGKSTVSTSVQATCSTDAAYSGACNAGKLVPAISTTSTSFHDTFHTVRVGLSYKFGGASAAPLASSGPIAARY